jgi:CBS domain-containing protein
MIAKELISEVVPSLKTSDSGQTALNWMETFKVSHLPIVNNQEFLGLISDSDIYDMNRLDEPIWNRTLTFLKPYIKVDQHIFEVISIAARLKLTIVPVLDDNNNFKGVITLQDIVKRLAEMSSFDQPGAIIVLELTERDYSLSQIAQIIEGNNVKVVSMYVASPVDSTKLEITIKLNSNEIASVIRTFERYNIPVKTWTASSDSIDRFYQERFDLLVKYLNI